MARSVVVDAMGGDDAPRAIIQGALRARSDGVPVRLVGRTKDLAPWLPRDGAPEVVHADDVVDMAEPPVAAVRRSQRSSLRIAMREVAQGRGDAVVSCGNTGAVLVAAVVELGTLAQVDRPALATVLPRADGGRLVLLDAGANVDVRPEVLATFAQLGTAYAEALGVDAPRVGLLSNGTEDTKGSALVREALPMVASCGVHFVGQVEPTTAIEGACDVLVTDGFTGNIFLKSAEGAVQTMTRLLRVEIMRSMWGRVGALLLRRALTRLRAQVEWDAHGGAVLLGTRSTVVVGHGRANPEAVRHAIHLAHDTATTGLVERIERRVAHGAAAKG